MKKIKLRAFSIKNDNFGKINSGFFDALQNRLSISESANDRRMVINAEEEKPEEDLISYHTEASKILFCTMLRIKPGKDVQHINATLFSKKKFTIADLHETTLDTTAIYKEHFYFGVSGDTLVTTLPGNITITRLQTYLNWYLEELYEISPIIAPATSKELSDIKSITMIDPINEKAIQQLEATPATQRNIYSIPGIVLDKLKSMLIDTKNLTDIELANLISAKLVIEFNKPKKDDSESLKKAYAALLKPISDLDHVHIKTRDNKLLKKGSDILRTQVVDVDLTDKGNINENTLIQAMAKFIKDIENETQTSS